MYDEYSIGSLEPAISWPNSTSAPLGAGETWTGEAHRTRHRDVQVTVKTDADGTGYADFSHDGLNWDSSLSFVISAGLSEYHVFQKGSRFFRLRIVNGLGAQSYLRAQCEFGDFRQGNAPLNLTIATDADATIVRSVNSELDLAFGRFGGMREDAKFGVAEDIDIADGACTIWHLASGDLSSRRLNKVFPTTAQTLYMSSDSASDTDLDITVEYIDADGYSQTLSDFNYTAGTTGAALGVSGLDINRAYVSGSSQEAGNLYFTTANAFTSGVPNDMSTCLSFIRAGYGQTEQCTYTIGVGKSIYIKHVIAYLARASGAAGSAQIHFRVKPYGKAWLVKRDYNITTSAPISKPAAGLVLPERTIIEAQLEAVSDNATNVTFEWHFDEVDV